MSHHRRLTLDQSLADDDEGGCGDTLDSYEHNARAALVERREHGVAINEDGVRLSGEILEGCVDRRDLDVLDDNIGRGACSQVQLARSRVDSRMYALKIFNIFDGPKRHQLFQEIRSLWNVSCPALIGFHGAYLDPSGKVCCILEYMDVGTLEDVIYRLGEEGPLPEDVLAAVAYHMLWGLAFLQHDKQLHRDVKPANVLLNRKGEAKLSDFGIARDVEEEDMARSTTGTYKYMSPERLNAKQYTYNSDVWSVGCVLLEGALKAYPFGKVTNPIELVQFFQETDVVELIRSCSLSEEFVEFLRLCLTMDPEQRCDAEELLDSPLFELYSISDYDSASEILRGWIEECIPERVLDLDYDEGHMLKTLGSSYNTYDDETSGRALCLQTFESFRGSVDDIAADMKNLDMGDKQQPAKGVYRADSFEHLPPAASKRY